MLDFATSQKPMQPSRHTTHSPEHGAGFTLFLVFVAGLAFGLLNDIVYLLSQAEACDYRASVGNLFRFIHPDFIGTLFSISVPFAKLFSRGKIFNPISSPLGKKQHSLHPLPWGRGLR